MTGHCTLPCDLHCGW